MIVRYYEFCRIEDFNYYTDTIDMRMKISMLLNKNIFPETNTLRTRINRISADFSPIENQLFRMFAIYYWIKSRDRLYRLHTNLVKHTQNNREC